MDTKILTAVEVLKLIEPSYLRVYTWVGFGSGHGVYADGGKNTIRDALGLVPATEKITIHQLGARDVYIGGPTPTTRSRMGWTSRSVLPARGTAK